MGREGIAYTFVAPEEGTQLTRIEMRIDKLLERSEIAGFSALDPKPTASLPTHEQQSGDGKGFWWLGRRSPGYSETSPITSWKKAWSKAFP